MIRVQREDFDPGRELDALAKGKHNIGGICSFLGLVRDVSTASDIKAMTLEHYPGMTERELEKIEAKAHERWDLDASLIIHRYGRMLPGERIVMVATASRHRQAAFESAQFLMDWLKTKAPFWKLEETEQGGQWVDARESDDEAAKRWNDTQDDANDDGQNDGQNDGQ